MLKSFILSLLLLTGITSFAQNSQEGVEQDSLTSELTKMFTTKISMKVDTTIFTKKLGNIYFSEDNKTMIFAMAVPQPIDSVEKNINKESDKKDFKVKEKGKIKIDGKDVNYQKGSTKKDGDKYSLNIYTLKGDEKTTILVTAMFQPDAEKVIEPKILEALKTVKLEPTKK